MIILDEQIKSQSIIAAIEQWYPGRVIHIQTLRPNTIIKDDNIPKLLLEAQFPIFVTINVSDFWRKIRAHSRYCIIAVDLVQQDYMELPDILRPLLNNPEFKTRALRMGKAIHVRKNSIEYYNKNNRIRTLK